MSVASMVIALLHLASGQMDPSWRGALLDVLAFDHRGFLNARMAQDVIPLRSVVSAAAIIVPESVVQNDFRLKMGDSAMCANDPVAMGEEKRVELATCSASLITRNRVITAAHCVADATPEDIRKIRVVFGYNDTRDVPVTAVRRVKDLLYCQYDPVSDIAVLELDEPAPDSASVLQRRRPVRNVVPSGNVHLMAYPKGLPLRISTCMGGAADCDQPKVTVSVGNSWLRARIGGIPGESGGAVLDENLRLLGVMHGGPPTMMPIPMFTRCDRSFQFDATCKGSWISRVDTEALPDALFREGTAFRAVSCPVSAGSARDRSCN